MGTILIPADATRHGAAITPQPAKATDSNSVEIFMMPIVMSISFWD
jgi:hypothetical protein